MISKRGRTPKIPQKRFFWFKLFESSQFLTLFLTSRKLKLVHFLLQIIKSCERWLQKGNPVIQIIYFEFGQKNQFWGEEILQRLGSARFFNTSNFPALFFNLFCNEKSAKNFDFSKLRVDPCHSNIFSLCKIQEIWNSFHGQSTRF